MQRLTKRISEDCIELSGICNPKFNGLPQRIYKTHDFWNVFETLCNKEDAEEKGLSVTLPCEIGSIIYAVETWDEPKRTDVIPYVFDGVEEKGLRLKDPNYEDYVNVFAFDELEKTVFTSHSKAKAAQKQKLHNQKKRI